MRSFRIRVVRWFYQLFLFTVAGTIAVISLEIGFRVARRGSVDFDRLGWEADNRENKSKKLYEKTDEFEFSAAINQYGFRGSEISLKKPGNVKRIMILGDSFVFGWGVNDSQTFFHLLEKEVNRGQKRYEIINTAGGSQSPLLYYVMLKNRLFQFKPDVVVVFVNYADIREDYLYKRNIIRDPQDNIVEVNPLYIDGRLDFWRWLRNKSEFCSYTYNKISRTLRRIRIIGFWNYIKAKLRGERTKSVMFEMEQEAVRDDIRPIEYDPYFMLREHSEAEEIKKYWAETSQYLSMTQELLRKDDIPFILVLLPNGVQVGPTQWIRGRIPWGFEQGKIYDNPLMTQLIRSFAKERGIGFVDLIPFFKKAGDRPLFFDRDGHLKPDGHKVLTQALLASPDFRAKIGLQ